jgi:hypothetical protein
LLLNVFSKDENYQYVHAHIDLYDSVTVVKKEEFDIEKYIDECHFPNDLEYILEVYKTFGKIREEFLQYMSSRFDKKKNDFLIL